MKTLLLYDVERNRMSAEPFDLGRIWPSEKYKQTKSIYDQIGSSTSVDVKESLGRFTAKQNFAHGTTATCV